MEKKEKKRRFQMPSAYVIVFIALLVVVVLTYFIPVSIHHPDTGEVVYNAILDENGAVVPDAGPQPYGIWDVILAPIKGFQDASNVGIALLMAGGFLSVLTATGGLDAGIGKMLQVLKGAPLIALMNLVFALMGTIFGFWEETLAFGLVVIPIFVRAGYDVMMGMAVMFLGATVGNMASVVNPFATGAAVAAIGDPNLTMGSGIVLRMVLFVAMYLLSTVLLIRYGAMVKAHPERSALYQVEGIKTGVDSDAALPPMTKKRIASIVLFVLMILLLVVGYIPWADIGGENISNIINAPIRALGKIPVLGSILGAGHMTPLGEWGFDEFSVLFFGGALLLLVINRLKLQDFIDQFLDGAKGLLGVVIVLSISRGIGVVMGDSSQGMSVTLVYWISNALAQLPQWVFAVVAVIAYVCIGIAMQSTSGVSGISMPILGAVAAALFAGSAIGSEGGGIVLISAFTIGLNFMCLIYPGAEVLGVSEIYGVPYSNYLKFMLKHAIPLLLIATIILSLAPYIGLVF